MKLGRPPTTLEQKQNKLSGLIEKLLKAKQKYIDSPTPSNKVTMLNLQNSVRAEKCRINKH